MRYFKLINKAGKTMDITTQEYFFHDISGLGFDTDNSFRRSGDVWRLDGSYYTQQPITGKMCFTENGDTDPYEKFNTFSRFVSESPLTLIYYPRGLNATEYRRTVKVKRLAKSELTLQGVLDEDIEFLPYTPWYKVFSDQNYGEETDTEENTGWIWGKQEGGVYTSPPLVFEPSEGQNATRAKFRAEPRPFVQINAATNGANPVKLTIFGPVINPTWAHYVDGILIETGGFAENFTLDENEELIIDSTEGDYLMTVRNIYTNASRNVYALRNFDTVCFFGLKEGQNRIVASSSDNSIVKIKIEGHIYYATV